MGTLWTAGQRLTAALLNQYYGYADTTPTTVTQATIQNLSSVYTIPAGEPQIGSAYELDCGGNGTWGSTRQNLTTGFYLAGTQIGVNQTIDFSVFSSSAGFRWAARIIVVCASTGVSGTWYGQETFTLTQIAGNVIPGTAANNTIPAADANQNAVTVSTASAIGVALRCQWASVTGGPTITCRHTTFRKIA